MHALQKDNNKTNIVFDKDLDITKYIIFPNAKKHSYEEVLEEVRKYYKDYDNIDFEFEATSIHKGDRVVRIGDYATVRDDHTSSLYERRLLGENQMWIRVLKSPNVNDDGDDGGNIEHIRKVRLSNVVHLQMQMILEIIKNNEQHRSWEEMIKSDVKAYKKANKISKKSSNKAFSDFTHTDDIDYEEYYLEGIDEDMERDFSNIDFNDRGHYYGMTRNTQGDADDEDDKDDEDHPNYRILQNLLQFTEVNLKNSGIVKYILDYCDSQHIDDEEERQQVLQAAEAEYRARINMNIPNDPQKAQKAQFLVQHKNTKDKIYKQAVNKKRVVTITATFLLIILAFWPKRLILKILPQCARHFAYNQTGEASLTSYFSCMLKHIGFDKTDLYFGNFTSLDLREIEESLTEEVNRVYNSVSDIRIKIIGNEALKKREKETDITDLKQYKKFFMFKPVLAMQKLKLPQNVQIPSNQKKSLKLLINMHHDIQGKTNLKTKFSIIPNIMNSCCMELLSKDYNYYSFFTSFEISKVISDFKKKKNNHTSAFYSNMNIPNIRIKDVDNQIVLENARIVLYEFNEAHDIHEIRFSVESDELLQNDINSNNDIFYAQLGAQTSIILDDFKTILGEENETFLILKHYMTTSRFNVSEVRHILSSYLKNVLPRILMQIKNLYKFDLENPMTQQFYFNLVNYCITHENDIHKLVDEIHPYLLNIDSIFMNTCSSIDNVQIIKNIAILSYIIVKTLGFIKELPDMFKHVAHNLTSVIKNNDHDIDALKMNIEYLREEMKKKHMGMFSKDKRTRKMQWENKQLGLDYTNFDIDEEFEYKKTKIVHQQSAEDGEPDEENHEDD